MRTFTTFFLCLTIVLSACAAGLPAAEAETPAIKPQITIAVDKPGIAISPTLWGIFYEEINCSGDGGLYAELVRNRIFEDPEKPGQKVKVGAVPPNWELVTAGGMKGEIALDDAKPLNTVNPHSLKLTIQPGGEGSVGVANSGWWGMGLAKDAAYNLSITARAEGFDGGLAVSLESVDGKTTYANGAVEKLSADWKPYAMALTSSGTDAKARLVIRASKPGTVWLKVVSLMPAKTFKGHGLRCDLAQMLADLKPAFVRFPGGCWVEGNTLAEAQRWKTTIGDIAQRRTQWNIWGYWATNGLGFHEYLQMCEDIGAQPLFVINCGMSHKEQHEQPSADKAVMAEYIQDALDAIEYANGPADSKWGSLRAKAGHPEPFNLKYMEIGNENGGKAYHERYTMFYKAIKAKYPRMNIVANHWGGTTPDAKKCEIVDEHYYNSPDFFVSQFHKYDKYDRSGHKVYVGEYAVTQNCGLGNLAGALGEAVFMAGMERNSDVVRLASYAPLFVNVNHRRWNPDLICFDSTRAYGIPSYYVQQMFSGNRGDTVLPLDLQSPIASIDIAKGGMIGVGTWNTQAEFKDIKVTGEDGKVLFESDFSKNTKGWKAQNGSWHVKDGALQQTADHDHDSRMVTGNKKWSNYTLSLKARKISGAEGFLILFRLPSDKARGWWNIGGWGNTSHAIEMPGVPSEHVEGKIETGRWYDIRVELKGATIKCYLDGKLIHDVPPPQTQCLYGAASRDNKSGEVILKVVNVSGQALETPIALTGAKNVAASATATVLASESPEDENTLEQPTKVAPAARPIPRAGANFNFTFPANSLTVIRVKAE